MLHGLIGFLLVPPPREATEKFRAAARIRIRLAVHGKALGTSTHGLSDGSSVNSHSLVFHEGPSANKVQANICNRKPG